MTSGQKTIASLIFSIIIFACFVIVSFAGLFSKVETRFYEPIKISSIQKQLDTISEKSENYINSHIEKFASEYLVQSSIASYASQQANDDDVKMRTQITGNLFSTTSALDGIRLIDSNGRNVHFSTYQNDILRENASLKMYKNYSDLQSSSGKNEFSFSAISTDSNDAKTSCRITYDGSEKRILLSFPFYDSYNAYRGTIIFYLSSDDFARTLLAQNIISVNDSCTLISNSNGTIGGFVFGMPVVGRDILEKEILEHWQKNSAGPTRILAIAPDESSENKNDNHSQNTYWILISSTQAKVAKISGVYNESTFVMNKTLQTLLQVCAFVTLFLIIFMLFNIRQDDMTVIKKRIQRFQKSIIKESLNEEKSKEDIAQTISAKKDVLIAEIQQRLGRRAKKHSDETNALIIKSIDEIINLLGSKNVTANISADELSKAISSLLEQSNQKNEDKSLTSKIASSENSRDENISNAFKDSENLIEDTKLVEVENLSEDVELLEAEELSEVEELSEIEDLSSEDEIIEEYSEQSEEKLEELLEVEDVQEAEDLSEVEELSEVEDLDELSDVVDADEVEELVDESEFLDARESADEFEKVDALDSEEDVSMTTKELEHFLMHSALKKQNESTSLDDFMAEKLQFGNQDEQSGHDNNQNANEEIEFTVVPVPDFSFLNTSSAENTKNDSQEKEFSDLLDVEQGTTLFNSFTLNNMAGENLYELESVQEDVIIPDQDGVFTIASSLQYNNVPQDEDFKNLVDSVLHIN